MSKRRDNSYFLTVQMSMAEKEALDEAAKKIGLNRNRFVRNWLKVYHDIPEMAKKLKK